MRQPPTPRQASSSRPARALRNLYAQIRGVLDPPTLHARLVSAWADMLDGAPVALFLPEAPGEGYQLAAANRPLHAPAQARLAAATLPPALRTPDGGEPPGPVRLPQPPPGWEPFAPLLAIPLGDPLGPDAGAGDESMDLTAPAPSGSTLPPARFTGLLLIGRRPDDRAYTAADRACMNLLAGPTALALSHVDLTEKQERTLLQLQALNRLGEELSANLDVEAVCSIVYQQLRGVLPFDSFFVARYDEEQHQLIFPFSIDEGVRYTLTPMDPDIGMTGWIFTHGRALVIDDLTRGRDQDDMVPRSEPFGSPRRSRSWMGVPMIAKHRVIGALAVQAYTAGLYRQEQVQFLSTVANQVASVLENAHRLSLTDTALAARVAQLSALEEVARLLNASLDLNRIIHLVVARAVETTAATAGIMALFDPATQALRLLGHIGYPQDVLDRYTQAPLPISQGLIGRAVREDRSLLVHDVQHDPDYIVVMPDIRAQLVVLVRRGGQVLGALSLESTEADGFSEEQVDFIEHLAEHTAIAVENARRYERERRQNEALTRRAGELAAILRISNALKADQALAEVLTQVVEGVRNSLGFNIAVLNLVDEGPPRTLVPAAAAGLDSTTWARLQTQRTTLQEIDRLMDPRFQVSQSYFISHIYALGEHLTGYYRPDLAPGSEQEWDPDDMLLVPLRGKGGQLLGLISVDAPVDRQLPTRATIETLEIFANQAAVAIENARLFEDQQRRLRELTLLQELGVRLTATLDPKELLHEVARSAVLLFEMHASMVVLVADPMNPRAGSGAVACVRQGERFEVIAYPMERLSALTAEVLAGSGPLVVPDVTLHPAAAPALETAGLVSLVGSALRAGNRVQGALYLLDNRPRIFSIPEQQLLQIFATQAAVAIQNARLFAEEAHRLRDVNSLQDLGLPLTATLEMNTLLEETAQSAVRLLDATSSGVLLIDSTGRRATNVRCWRRAGPSLEITKYESRVRPGGLTETIIRTGRALMISDSGNDPRVNPATLAEGIRSFVAVPIRVADKTLGVLFVNEHQPRAFATHEQQLVQIFANQVAVAITNARLFEERRIFERHIVAENERMARELVTARATQRQLLPVMPRHLAGLALHGICLPAMEVGGDYFDVLPLADGRLALALGDVTGKGTAAVMLMAMIKTALFSQVSADPTPAAVITALNTLAVDFMQGQLMTFFYALYDPAGRTLTYANAGHLFPYVRRADGTLDSLGLGSLPIGALPALVPKGGEARLAPGDLLVLFSDGIVEAVSDDGELFSFERLEALLLQAGPVHDPLLLVEDLVDRVHAFAGGVPQDDATLLVALVE